MKKQALYVGMVVVVLGGTVAGASAYTGRAVTTRLSQHTVQFGKLLPGLQVKEQIERGLFHSTRTVTLELGCLPAPDGDGQSVAKSAPIEVQWRDTIRHVPWLRGAATIDSELSMPGAEKLFGNGAPLTIHTDVGFDGRFTSDAKVAAFKLQPKPGDELEFSGLVMHLTGQLPEGPGTFSYTGSTEPLRVIAKAEDGNFTANLGKMELTGSADIDPDAPTFILPYRTETRMSELTMQVALPARDGGEPTHFAFAMRGMKAKAESKIEKDLLSNSSRFEGALKADSYAIDKFEMGVAVKNLHVPTLTKLMQTSLTQSFSCDQPRGLEASMAEFAALAETAFALLPHNPEYQVGPIAIELGGQRAELEYTVGVRGVAAGVAPPPMMELALKHGFARAEAKLHLGLIDKLATCCAQPGAAPSEAAMGLAMARGMLDGFVQQGYVEREGELVRARFEVDAGSFKLNGRPFDLPDLGALGGPDLGAVKSLMQVAGPGDDEPAGAGEGDL